MILVFVIIRAIKVDVFAKKHFLSPNNDTVSELFRQLTRMQRLQLIFFL